MKPIYSTIIIILFSINLFSQNKSAKILQHEEEIETEELEILNSSFRETNLSISPDGKYLYFMTDRGGMSWSTSYDTFRGQKRFDGDIWYSSNKDGVWQKPVCLDNTVNTSSGEDEPNISPDGQFVTYQSWAWGWESKGGPYYTSMLEKGKWKQPKGLGGGITKFFDEKFTATDGMSLSPDKNTFIVAAGSDYDGNLDIYISKRENEKWTYCQSVSINTKSDERSVFIAGDGKTLFFASDGYGGFGGLDILKTTINEDGTFGSVENLGEPFNTENDDYGFILTASGNDAYFVRDGDIFHAVLTEAFDDLKPEPTILIGGIITDCDNKKIETFVELYNTDEDKKLATSKSGSDGAYLFSFIEKAGNYKIISEKGDYEIDTSFYISKLDEYQEINFNFNTCADEEVFEIKTNTSEISENKIENSQTSKNELSLIVNFDLNEDSLKIDFYDEIDEFIKQTDSLDNYKIELIGHTDNKGSDEYNTDLGLRRAENVKEYLISQGVPKGKIKITTKGEKTPTSRNDTEEGAYQNRRVEIKIF